MREKNNKIKEVKWKEETLLSAISCNDSVSFLFNFERKRKKNQLNKKVNVNLYFLFRGAKKKKFSNLNNQSKQSSIITSKEL